MREGFRTLMFAGARKNTPKPEMLVDLHRQRLSNRSSGITCACQRVTSSRCKRLINAAATSPINVRS
jgi:hypothetical protein